MKTYNHLWKWLCHKANLNLAFEKARKGKTKKKYTIDFSKDLDDNLTNIRNELLFHTYSPQPLKSFIIRDPKTRKISKSEFRDRVVHHALINILESIFEKRFIYDSYANRKGKGTLNALKRFDCFKRKVSKNNTRTCYILKADIKHYFETVDHDFLIKIIKRKIKDEKVIWLIKKIINNFETKIKGKGMPLGNLTSQFFANVYLNELDYFIKHQLKVKYYIRYVDDFIILHDNKKVLEYYKKEIDLFLKMKLELELHPTKSKIKTINQGVNFLGFRVFYYHKLLKKSNIKKEKRLLIEFKNKLDKNEITYDKVYCSFEGWLSYAKNGNTYKLRKKLISTFEQLSPNQISSLEVNKLLKIIRPW